MVALLIALLVGVVIIAACVLAWRHVRRVEDEMDFPEAQNQDGSEIDPNAARLGIALTSTHGPGY
ncbi:MAG TPA: hypothetical protein VE442_18310 [Jatrophihabitans sp.]|jgi:hypothetical protein|nr:hypothetical protein [Jatrophihabitans sp.]